MMPFEVLFPALAKRESRVIDALDHPHLPRGTFVLREAYCTDPGCDCRRVLIQVMWAERATQVATINYAFEPTTPPFDDEPQVFLDPLNPQSDLSGALLSMFETMIESDRGYHDRLVRHYEIWKHVVDDPAHPDHAKVRSKLADDPLFKPAFPRQDPVRREGPTISPNDSCPCGSGRKYKRCCRP